MLTDVEIRALKPGPKAYKRGDEKGLFLLVQPTGTLIWRLKYHLHGIERTLSLGHYPEVGLKRAREKRDEARAMLAEGIDPVADKREKALKAAIAAATTFRVVADEFIEKMEHEGKSPATLKKARWFRDALHGAIGRRPIADVTPHELLDVLKRVERRGHHETAQRMRAFAGRVFRYAIATLRTDRNPADVLRGALVVPRVKHHAAILEPVAVGALLRAIDGYNGRPETKIALQLLPHLFLRPGELRKAEWSEIDFKAAIWRIPGERMKMKQAHVVPLSSQSLRMLKALREIGNPGNFLFPAFHTSQRPMCENTLNASLRRLGYSKNEMTSHGFRAVASTLLNESGLWHPDAIERALAHQDRDHVRSAYHRGTHWAERVKMAQWWSDYLDDLRRGGEVVELRRFG